LISGALEPSFFAEAKKIGLPIKIQIINPTNSTPIFRYEPDPNASTNPSDNKGVLCVKSKTKDFAVRALGTGINQPGYKHPTLSKSPDGFYRINGNENIFKEDPDHTDIINDPTAVTLFNLLQPALKNNGFTNIDEFEEWKKNKSKNKRQVDDIQVELIVVYLNAYKAAIARAKKAMEEPFKPSKTAVKTYELFNERIMENTGKFEAPVYLIVTGGFATAKDVIDTFKGKKSTMPNIRALIDRVQQVLDFQVHDLRDKGKPVASRLIKAFSRKDLIQKVITMDKKNFPNGFFIDIIPGNKLGYFNPADIDFPFADIGAKSLLDKVRKYAESLQTNPATQKIPAYDAILKKLAAGYKLPATMPKQAKINKDLANKVLIAIAVNEFLGAINVLQIPFPNPNSQQVEDFKKAMREFNLLKKISDDSRSTSILTERECKEINDNINKFRKKVVLPLAKQVLPSSMKIGRQRINKSEIIKRLGILNEVFSQPDFDMNIDMPTSLPDFDIELDKYFDLEDAHADAADLNTANIETVLNLLFNMEDLLMLIMEIGMKDPVQATNMLLSSTINERKKIDIYQKILLELLK